MIIQLVPQKKQINRSRIGSLIQYIFGKTKQPIELSQSKTSHDPVEYIGCSISMNIVNPFFVEKNGKIEKVSPQEVNLEYIISSMLEPESFNIRVEQPFEHFVVSLPEGEALSNRKWHMLIEKMINQLGLNDNHWIAVKHNETSNQHCHIVAQMITNSPPHNRVVLHNSYKALAKVRNELESEFLLKHDYNPYSDGFKAGAKRQHYQSAVNKVRKSVDLALTESKISLPEFMQKLQANGIGCFAQLRKGELIGLSFTSDHLKIRASKLGIGYRLKDLLERGVFYNVKNHQELVEELNELEYFVSDTATKLCKIKSENVEGNSIFLGYVGHKKKLNKNPKGKTNIFSLWLPINTAGKSKTQIESEIETRKFIRTVLSWYFAWLRDKRSIDESAIEILNQCMRPESNQSLFSHLEQKMDSRQFASAAPNEETISNSQRVRYMDNALEV